MVSECKSVFNSSLRQPYCLRTGISKVAIANKQKLAFICISVLP